MGTVKNSVSKIDSQMEEGGNEKNTFTDEENDSEGEDQKRQRQRVSELLDIDFPLPPEECSAHKSDAPQGKQSKASSSSAVNEGSTSNNQELDFNFSNGGIENIDLTGIVKGHLHYPDVLCQIMKVIGLED